MTGSRRKPAQASIALTRSNYVGPTLLQTINGKPTSPTRPVASSPAQTTPRTERVSSEDIYALPESDSSDEEVSIQLTSSPAPQLGEIFEDIGQDALKGRTESTRESKGGMPSTRQRQLRLKDEDNQLPSAPPLESEPSREDELMDSWPSQSNKRRKTVYGSKITRAIGGFKQVPAAPDLPEKDGSVSSFSMPKIHHYSPQTRTRSSRKNNFISPPAVSDQAILDQKTGPGFNVPDVPTGITSSVTSASESVTIFNHLNSPKYSLKRSNSTSSLSSVDSYASLILSQERKQALRQGEDDDEHSQGATTSRCPLCRAKVNKVHLETFSFGRRLNIRDQQRFCQEHRRRDAEKLREKMEYPSIDWPTLTDDRIPKHIAQLTGILKRTLPSYYRDRLEAAIEEAKASRKGLQRYLKEGIVDVAKHGYYGPKGARVMGHAITMHMSSSLKQQLKRDKVARAAGVGGYVNAVLVPELAVRLVMEDMGFKDEQQARDVLSESSNLGILLNADDENVVREEEEEEPED
jgi:hypothetical protein